MHAPPLNDKGRIFCSPYRRTVIRLYNALYSSVKLPIYPNQTLLARALRTLSALNGIVCAPLIGKTLYSAFDICEVLVMLSKSQQLAQR